MLEVRLLGGFSAVRDGVLLTWPNAKTRALFQILVGERGRYFSKDQLIEWLWPDSPIKSASANLRGRVRELRRLLEPDLPKGRASRYIETLPEGYRFSPEAPCRVDVEEFLAALREAEAKHQEGDLAEAQEALERALGLYRGEYLPEVPYEDWALERRAHLKERHREALERLAEIYIRRGRLPEARSRCLQLLEEEPCRESAWRLLMGIQAALGERAEALKTYERCRRTLRRELGEEVEPSPATRELYEHLRKGRPFPIPIPAPVPGPSPPLPPSSPEPTAGVGAGATTEIALPEEGARLGGLPLVGRDQELRRLLERAQRARAGQAGLVLLVGEAGVGKTRLAEELLAGLGGGSASGAGDWLILRGRCPALEAPPPLLPLAEALRALPDPEMLTQAVEGLPASLRGELSALLPDLPLPETRIETDPELRRLRLFEALSQLFLRLAEERPAALLLDDLHDADSSTLDWLKLFLPRALRAQARLLILATAREEEAEALEDLRHEGLRGGWLEELSLEPLVPEAIETLARRLSPRPALAELLRRHAAGNPLFITALLDWLVERGLLRWDREAGSWQLLPEALPALDRVGKPLPREVRELVRRRLRALEPAERELLFAAAICGPRAPVSLLWNVLGREDYDALEALLRRRLLVEVEGGGEGDNGELVGFPHELVWEAVYTELSAARRRAAHARAARALEARRAPPEALFFQWARSDEPSKAIEPGLQALEAACRAYQNEEALDISETLLKLLESSQDEHREAREFAVRARRVDVLGLLGRQEEQERELEKLFSLARGLSEKHQAEAFRRRARFHEAAGRLEEARKDAEEALKLAQGPAERAEAHLVLGNVALDAGGLPEAQRHYEEALRLYEEAGEEGGQAQALNNLGIVFYYLGAYEEARARYERALALNRRRNDPREVGKVLNNLGDVYGLLGDWDEAQRCLEESVRLRREVGDRRGELITLANLGELFVRRGEPEKALEPLKEAVERAEEPGVGSPALEAAVRARRAWALLELQDLEGAKREVEEAYGRVEAGHAREFAPEIYFRAFQVFRAAGQEQQAKKALRRAYEELQSRAAGLPEPFRRRFLEVPTHREIRETWLGLGRP